MYSKVLVAKWPTFGKGADLVNILFVLCLLELLVLSHFGFEGSNLILVEPVPGHRFPFTFFRMTG